MFGFYGYLARLRVYTPNYATRLQGKYLWDEYFTLHKLNLSFHSPSFWLKKAKFEALTAPEREEIILARLKLQKHLQ